MTIQATLFDTNQKSKVIIHTSPDLLRISPYNPRKTRSAEYITKLAERISANGYEITRAMWAYREGEEYAIFAGGTRLKASREAKIPQVPIVLHTGYTDEEIVKLAVEDNENDEYHESVSIVDTWASYQALADLGWTQERIAKAKGEGVGKSLVSERIKWHNLSDDVKNKVLAGILSESHLREITSIVLAPELFPWLTTSIAQLKLATWAANGHTTRETRERVRVWKEFIECAQDVYGKLSEVITLYDLSNDEPQLIEYHPRKVFVELLAQSNARSLSAIKRAKGKIDIYIADNLRDYKTWIDARTEDEARKAIHARKVEELLSKVHLGSYQNVLAQLPDESVDLIFTDPPYDQEHVADYGKLAQIAARVLKPKGSLIVYAGHYALPQIFKLMCPHLTYWWQLVVKHSGAAARQPGKWVFVHYKPLLWFTKDGRRDNRYVSDFIHSEQPKKNLHKWEQDVSEAKYCIEQLTNEGDMVVDPFCGSGTTAIAALTLGRDFIAGDIDEASIEMTNGRLLQWLDTQ